MLGWERAGVRALGLALLLVLTAAAATPEPDGYRIDGLQDEAPPATLRGATVLSAEQAHAIWAAHAAAFIDVLPQPPRPAGLPADTLWHPKRRFDIPGSVWLPDTGYGALSPEMEAYYRDNLAAATGGDHDRPVVIYCRTKCWMSWNAAKRALAFGYTHVGWFPGGADDWGAAGYALEPRTPVKRPGE